MKSMRLFNLLILLSEKRKMSSTELAEKLEVSVRTIYRDVDVLSQAGIPVYATTGKNGGIHLMNGFVFDKSTFSDEEQQSIINSLQSLRYVPGVDVELIKTKFATIFNKRAMDKDDWLEIDFATWTSGNGDNDLITAIRDSIRSSNSLCISYINAHSEDKERVIDPIKVVFRQRDWFLYAYCQLQKDYRWFKLTRITKFKSLNRMFNSNEHKYTPHSEFADSGKPKTHIELRFTLNLAHFVYDMFDRNCIYRENADAIRVSIDYIIDEWVYNIIMFFGENVTVLEPTALKEEIAKRHRKALENISSTMQ
jgi:predicted DNA-binding transcriptional regulator YafY